MSILRKLFSRPNSTSSSRPSVSSSHPSPSLHLNKNEQRVLNLLSHGNPSDIATIQRKLHLSRSTAYRIVQSLQKHQLIVAKKSGRSAVYTAKIH